MKKQYLLALFIACLAFELFFTFSGNNTLRYISKPLLMPLLFFLYMAGVKEKGISKAIIGALFFSWLGDILLMFDSGNSLFFILGLSAFLLAHIFYVFFFHAIRVQEGIKPKALLLIPVVVYYAVLMSILSPWLGDMKLPVRIYGVVICFMLMLAMHMLYLRNKKAGSWLAIGALLFVVSDSVLAVNKFYHSFIGAGFIVMLTYGLAQVLLIQGAISYTNDVAKT